VIRINLGCKMSNPPDIQEHIQTQANFWSKPSVVAQLSYCVTLQGELKRLQESLATEQQVLPHEQQYCVEMSAYVDNLRLQKESMATFLENTENHGWLTHILRLSMVMERAFASLAKPWSIAERTVNLSLDASKPLLCDVYSDMSELQKLYDAVQKILEVLESRDKISAEQRCVIDFAKKVSERYTHFLSMRMALKEVAVKPQANEFLAWCRAQWNSIYREYDANHSVLLARTRNISSQICGERNALARTIRVSEEQFQQMIAIHGSLKGLEATIVEQEKVLNSANKKYEARLQKVNALQSDIAELCLRLDCALGRKPTYIVQTPGCAARAAA
jgi:hypothetical protein